MGAVQKTAISKDGTVIAYEQSGSGPTLILVSAALADRSGNRRLARHLSDRFTVVNYDRRGRGTSGDRSPYTTGKEIDDIEALVDASEGSAFLFGSSSGSVLALDAAARLGPKVRKLYMFEPPFIVDSSRPPMDTTLSSAIDRQISNGNRGEAVRMFFTRGMGIPPFGVTMMRFLMPGWSKMCAMAHTIPYDLAILNGTQAGMRLPDARWKSASLPIKVAVGSKSEPFFHSGAKGLVQILPSAEYQSLAGLNHGALLFAPAALGRDVQDFLLRH
ncbi:MAG: alpha/beta hydrolase [Acidobacteriales bacterium 59-55]|nr:MAG: alpha/beta hydrolase [Acidobacteriales bacterium 59-55]